VTGLGVARVACALAGLGCVAGCATGHAPEDRGPLLAQGAPRTTDPQADPRGYLHFVMDQCAGLEQYTLVFTRQERRGLIPVLHPPERIAAWFRRQPFSVRMKWLDPDVKYGESTYVEGRHDDQVRFVPRRGFLGLKPGIVSISLTTPVVWGESRYPLTDFGLENLMRRTLRTLGEARWGCRVEYVGRERLEGSGPVAHHIRLSYSADEFPAPIQDLFIDAETHLPALTRVTQVDGDLDGSYRYERVDPNVRLTDEDFLLDFERRAAEDKSLVPRLPAPTDAPPRPLDP
jgi:hypothetical protein